MQILNDTTIRQKMVLINYTNIGTRPLDLEPCDICVFSNTSLRSYRAQQKTARLRKIPTGACAFLPTETQTADYVHDL